MIEKHRRSFGRKFFFPLIRQVQALTLADWQSYGSGIATGGEDIADS